MSDEPNTEQNAPRPDQRIVRWLRLLVAAVVLLVVAVGGLVFVTLSNDTEYTPAQIAEIDSPCGDIADLGDDPYNCSLESAQAQDYVCDGANPRDWILVNTYYDDIDRGVLGNYTWQCQELWDIEAEDTADSED